MFANAGCQGAINLSEAIVLNSHVAMRPDMRKLMNKNSPWNRLLNKAEQLKGSAGGKVKSPLKFIKCQIGFNKVSYQDQLRTPRS